MCTRSYSDHERGVYKLYITCSIIFLIPKINLPLIPPRALCLRLSRWLGSAMLVGCKTNGNKLSQEDNGTIVHFLFWARLEG